MDIEAKLPDKQTDSLFQKVKTLELENKVLSKKVDQLEKKIKERSEESNENNRTDIRIILLLLSLLGLILTAIYLFYKE